MLDEARIAGTSTGSGIVWQELLAILQDGGLIPHVRKELGKA